MGGTDSEQAPAGLRAPNGAVGQGTGRTHRVAGAELTQRT